MNNKIDNKVKTILGSLYEEGSNTYKTYYRNFKQIHLELGNKISFNQYKNIDNVVKKINEMDEKKTTRKMRLISIGMILSKVKNFKKISEKYKKISKNLTNEIEETNIQNIMSDKQKEKLVPYKDLIDKVKKLKKLKNDKYTDFMVCFMYVVPIFTPRNEYMKLDVYYDNQEHTGNYLLVSDNSIKIVLQKYKTSKKYGKIEYTYEKRVQKEIRDYLSHLNNPSMIFNLNRQNLAKKLTKYLGVSVQFIRTIKNDWYVNQKKFKDMSGEKKKEKLIQLFQHGIFQSFTSYKKEDLNKK